MSMITDCNRVALVVLLVASGLVSQPGFAGNGDVTAIYEDVTRENTVAAYIEFVKKYPDSKFASQAYRLAEKAFADEARTVNKLGKSGSINCTVGAETMLQVASITSRCNSDRVPPVVCTRFVQKQTVTNTTQYPVLVINSTPKEDDDEETILNPGQTFSDTAEMEGKGCRGRVTGSGRNCKYVNTCNKTPEIDEKKLLFNATPVSQEEADLLKTVVKDKTLISLRKFLATYPNSPAASHFRYVEKDWFKRDTEIAASQLETIVSYTKKWSPAFPNPYDLELRNKGSFPIQVSLVVEKAEFEQAFTLAAGESVTVPGITQKGAKADFKTRVYVETFDFPERIFARNRGDSGILLDCGITQPFEKGAFLCHGVIKGVRRYPNYDGDFCLVDYSEFNDRRLVARIEMRSCRDSGKVSSNNKPVMENVSGPNLEIQWESDGWRNNAENLPFKAVSAEEYEAIKTKLGN